MIQKSGINKIRPSHKDYSFLHTFGATQFNPLTLPDSFSIYDGRPIPNQDASDTRFSPALSPLPFGCTAETTTYIGMLEDGDPIYNPQDFYDNTPPGTQGVGRDIRTALQCAIDRGYFDAQEVLGNKRTAYFNIYAAGAIDDFDAARIALWINQTEKRGVSVGSWWYPEFSQPDSNGSLPLPSFNTSQATLHNHLIVGWRTLNGVQELQDISWQGENYGQAGVVWINRDIFNALINQPNTAMFTLTKVPQNTPFISLGAQVYIDELVNFVLDLFNLTYGWYKGTAPTPLVAQMAQALLGLHLTLNTAVSEEEGCAQAVSFVLKNSLLPIPSGGISTVSALIEWMMRNGFKELAAPTVGCVITAHNADLSKATGFAHTGICLQNGIASNNSMGHNMGKFTLNYSYEGWLSYFTKVGGSKTRYFEPPN